jgi:hypothetical protein
MVKLNRLISIFITSLILPGCGTRFSNQNQQKEIPSYRYQQKTPPASNKAKTTRDPRDMSHEDLLNKYLKLTEEEGVAKSENEGTLAKDSLDFLVKNKTGKIIHTTCFSYTKKGESNRWRWDKSPVLSIAPGQSRVVDIDELSNPRNRKNVFGYLAVFETREEALGASYELLDDRKSLDLDLLHKLKNKTVVVEVERYGAKTERFEYFLESETPEASQKELDFYVENKTGKPVHVACFIYEQRQDSDDQSPWRYVKTGVQYLENSEIAVVDVNTIKEKYDWEYMRGGLAVFEKDEEEIAQAATYQLLAPEKKLALGRLSTLQGKKVTLEIERYGNTGDFVDFVVRPLNGQG